MPDAFLNTILEGIGEGFYAVDREWRITHFNSEAGRHFRCTAEDVLGRVLWDVFPTAKDTELGRTFLATMASRETLRSDTPSMVVEERWLAYRLFPLADGMGVVFRDITDRKRAEEALSASEEMFRNLAESLPHLIWIMRPDGFATYFNQRFKEYHGYDVAGELVDRSSNIHPDDKPAAWEIREPAIAAGLPFEAEVRTRRHDGEYRWFRMSAVPLKREGRATAYVGIAIDIHELRMAEAALKQHVRHQELLIHELNHRVKNTLAIVQSIALQTLRETPRGTRDAFEARLLALARAYDVLTAEKWEAADLHQIIAQAMAPYAVDGETRFEIVGSPLALSPSTALTLSMIIHELATNAAKYGALNSDTGTVRIAWSAVGTTGDAILVQWMETGGPPVVTPTRTGFGSRLLKQSFRDMMGAGINIDYRPTGVICTMTIPSG